MSKEVSKTILKAAARYMAKISAGERVIRDANRKMHWADGRSVGEKTILHMLHCGQIKQLDADLFGDFTHGQTSGV